MCAFFAGHSTAASDLGAPARSGRGAAQPPADFGPVCIRRCCCLRDGRLGALRARHAQVLGVPGVQDKEGLQRRRGRQTGFQALLLRVRRGLLPTDLAKLTVMKLMEELQKRGLETKGLKAALVSRLQKVVNTEEPKARPPSAPTPKKAPAASKPSQKILPQAHDYIFDFGQHVGKSLKCGRRTPLTCAGYWRRGFTTSMRPYTMPLRDAGKSPLS